MGSWRYILVVTILKSPWNIWKVHPVIDPMIPPAKTGAVEDSRGPLDWLINAFVFVLVAIVAFERVHGLLKFLICTLEIITSPVNSA